MLRFLLAVLDWFLHLIGLKVNMNQIYSYEVVKNSAQAVVMPLKSCISSLDRVYEALADVDVNPITGHCSNYDYIRQQIVQAWKSLQLSDQAATTCLRRLDKTLEILTRNKGTLERQKDDTKCTLDNLRTEQVSNEKMLRDSKGALKQAKANLTSTKETVQRQERRAKTASAVRAVGLGVTVIPFVGWVVGPAMVIGSMIELKEASKAKKIAEEELQKFKNQVDTYKSKVHDHKNKIFQTDLNIDEMDQKLTQIHNDIYMVKKQRRSLSEFQQKVRSAVHVLSVLVGRVNVLELHTRRFIPHESVLQVMEDVMKSARELTGNELLCNTEVLRLVGKMRRTDRRLRAIRASRNNAADNSVLQNYI